MRTVDRPARCFPLRRSSLLAAGVLTVAVPATVSATGFRPAVQEAGSAGAVLPAPDTTPSGVPASPVPGPLTPSGSSVMEGAWGSEGDPAVLHVVTAAMEPEPVAGLTLRMELLAKWGHDGVPFPSSQGLSSLDADDFGGLGEAWVEWRMAAGVRLKAGRVDANTEFAAAESAALFVNPSFGLSPALGLLPSYPTPAPSLNLFVRPAPDGAEMGAGVYRAADGTWSAVGQVAGSAGPLPFRWAAGVAAPLRSGPAGADPSSAGYVIVEGGPDDRLASFGKVAVAGDLLHLAGGLTAPLPAPVETRAGIAGSLVSGPEHGVGDELVAEVFLTVRPASWLVVQPDVQLRLAPGSSPRTGALLRVVVER